MTSNKLARQQDQQGNIYDQLSSLKEKEAERVRRSQMPFQEQMYNEQRDYLEPWRDVGTRALAGLESGQYAGYEGPSFMDNWKDDKAYTFRMDQGLEAAGLSPSSRGGGHSNSAVNDALTKYSQGLASDEYSNIYNRNFGRLSQLAGLGTGADLQAVNAANQFGNASADNSISRANADASASIARGNMYSNLIGQGVTAGALAYNRAPS